MRFPTLHARDLEGRAYTLPDDLPGAVRVVLLPFKQWHQVLVEEWQRALATALESRDDVTVWEVPSIGKLWKPARGYIDGGMRAGIPDIDVRRHTLTDYGELDTIAAGLGVMNFETIHVFLLDATGEILWRDSGEPNLEKAASFAAALESSRL